MVDQIIAYIIVAIIVAAIQTVLSYILGPLLADDIDPPELDEQRRFTQRPTPPRVVVYGEAWVAPSIIRSGNGRIHGGSGQTDRANRSPQGYSLLCAIADHEVDLLDFHLNGERVLTDTEFADVVAEKYVVCSSSAGGSVSATRLDANERAREDSGGRGRYTLSAVLKGRGRVSIHPANVPDVNGGTSTWPRIFTPFTPVKNTLPFNEISTGDYLNWAGSYGDGDYVGHDSHNVARYKAMTFYNEGERDMHCFGTSTLFLTFPILYDKTKQPLWANVPKCEVKVGRPKETITLWNPVLPGAPPIDPAWAGNNAALCCYDYLARYTDYANPVCGVERIDLQSVAEAARYCHDQGYFYPLVREDADWDTAQHRDSWQERRSVWKHEYSLQVNGTFNLNNSRSQILRQFEYAMGGGRLTQASGVVSVHAGQARLPTKHYGDNEIIEGSWSIQSSPRATRRGVTYVAYNDLEGDRQAVSFQHQGTERNLKVATLHGLFINREWQARRLAWVENLRAWATEGITFKIAAHTERPEVDEVVTLSMPSRGVEGSYRVLTISVDGETGESEIVTASEPENTYITPPDTNYTPPPRARTIPQAEAQDKLLVLKNDSNGNPVYLKTREGEVLALNKTLPW